MGLGETVCSSVLCVYLKEAQCSSNEDIHKVQKMNIWIKIQSNRGG